MDEIRSFIACKIPFCDSLAEVVNDFKNAGSSKVNWVDPLNFHITLIFLGNIHANDCKVIHEKIQLVAEDFGKIEYHVKGIGVFPSEKQPRVLWFGIENDSEIRMFQKRLEDVLQIKPEKEFRSHVTFGRIKYNIDQQILRVLLRKYHNRGFVKGFFKEVILFRSVFTKNGVVYKPLEKCPLNTMATDDS
jgi:2'-5' RNA ligase